MAFVRQRDNNFAMLGHGVRFCFNFIMVAKSRERFALNSSSGVRTDMSLSHFVADICFDLSWDYLLWCQLLALSLQSNSTIEVLEIELWVVFNFTCQICSVSISSFCFFRFTILVLPNSNYFNHGIQIQIHGCLLICCLCIFWLCVWRCCGCIFTFATAF